MSGEIRFLLLLALVTSIIGSLSSCHNAVGLDKTLINPSIASPAPLLPESLSNGGKAYQGHTNVTFLLETPINTPANSDIYLSGTFDAWSGGNSDKYKFKKIADNAYQLTVEEDAGSILQFKVTRGSWAFGEVDERGRRAANRVLYVRNKQLIVKLLVRNWNDKSDEIKNTDFGYWNTEIPDYKNEPLKPSLKLNGRNIIEVSSLDEFNEEGVRATNKDGVNLSNKLKVKGLPANNNPGDYLITYEISDEKGRKAIPVSRMLRIAGNQPIHYSLRPVGTTSSHLGYIEQLPANYRYSATKKYPLFIYHHGAGVEASSMNLSRKTALFELANSWDGGPARIAVRGHWNTQSPLIVLSPQRSFFESDITSIDAFVDYAIKNYQVDPERIYMGGFSAGGFISWEYAINYPNKVAAILPLAGAVPSHLKERICDAKDTAVWAFHGADDPIVNVEKAKAAIDVFNKCQPKESARLSVFDDVGHSSHQRVLELTGMLKYSDLGDPFNENIYSWMMSKKVQGN
jgi:predicted esterase